MDACSSSGRCFQLDVDEIVRRHGEAMGHCQTN